MDREPETEIVSDAPMRPRRKAAKKATELERALAGDVVRTGGEPVVQRLPALVQGEAIQRLPKEEIRELVVERIAPNPRLVLASYEEGGVRQVVRVRVGSNKNFRTKMKLRAQRGASENAPWRLIGRRPRLPGRW